MHFNYSVLYRSHQHLFLIPLALALFIHNISFCSSAKLKSPSFALRRGNRKSLLNDQTHVRVIEIFCVPPSRVFRMENNCSHRAHTTARLHRPQTSAQITSIGQHKTITGFSALGARGFLPIKNQMRFFFSVFFLRKTIVTSKTQSLKGNWR